MTTNPKASKFRVRRIVPAARSPQPAPAAQPAAEAGPGPDSFPTTGQDMLVSSDPAGSEPPAREAELAAIRAEGLTGRQLRMARRVAVRHGIEAATDEEAVLALRKRGIDPFQRSSVLALVTPEGAGAVADDKVQLPQTTVPGGGSLPAPRVFDDSRRAAEILKIQRDIARRRRRKIYMLGARLAVFVLLPTIIAGWYYYNVATPLDATRSEFVIQKAEAQQAAGLGSLFQGTQFATTQDSIAVQSYLQSRDAMLRLDADLGFKSHFSDPSIDPIQRLAADATNEAGRPPICFGVR